MAFIIDQSVFSFFSTGMLQSGEKKPTCIVLINMKLGPGVLNRTTFIGSISNLLLKIRKEKKFMSKVYSFYASVTWHHLNLPLSSGGWATLVIKVLWYLPPRDFYHLKSSSKDSRKYKELLSLNLNVLPIWNPK